jgi:hypothetical protein
VSDSDDDFKARIAASIAKKKEQSNSSAAIATIDSTTSIKEQRKQLPPSTTLSGEKPRKHIVKKQQQQRAPDVQQTPPHSDEAEQGVIGSIFQSAGKVIAECVEKINPEFFYNPVLRTLYIELLDTWDSGKKIDLITFTQRLRDRKILDALGGVGFVTHLAVDYVPTAANVAYYLDIVREKSIARELIATWTEGVGQLQNLMPGQEPSEISFEVESRMVSIQSLSRNGAIENRSLIDYVEMDSKIIKLANLLGMRWLCRKGIALLVGATGVGKSSASIQAMILWALEREAFGIKPARALKFLYVQAENDDGDMQELVAGVCDHFKFSAVERDIIRHNVIVINERSLSGKKFLARLRSLVRKHKPDIVWIDPLQAYAGGDVKDSAVTTAFLRNGLNPILDEADCAAIISHHSTKTINLDTSEWTRTDWNYFGAGGAEIANVARAVLNITHTKTPGVFTWHGGKRWDRIGWCDEDGNATDEHVYCWHKLGAIHWRDADDSDLARMRSGERAAHGGKTEEDFFNLVPQTGTIRKDLLFARRRDAGLSREAARDFYKVLIDDKRIFEWEIPRPNARPEIHVSRKPQPEPELIKS